MRVFGDNKEKSISDNDDSMKKLWSMSDELDRAVSNMKTKSITTSPIQYDTSGNYTLTQNDLNRNDLTQNTLTQNDLNSNNENKNEINILKDISDKLSVLITTNEKIEKSLVYSENVKLSEKSLSDKVINQNVHDDIKTDKLSIDYLINKSLQNNALSLSPVNVNPITADNITAEEINVNLINVNPLVRGIGSYRRFPSTIGMNTPSTIGMNTSSINNKINDILNMPSANVQSTNIYSSNMYSANAQHNISDDSQNTLQSIHIPQVPYTYTQHTQQNMYVPRVISNNIKYDNVRYEDINHNNVRYEDANHNNVGYEDANHNNVGYEDVNRGDVEYGEVIVDSLNCRMDELIDVNKKILECFTTQKNASNLHTSLRNTMVHEDVVNAEFDSQLNKKLDIMIDINQRILNEYLSERDEGEYFRKDDTATTTMTTIDIFGTLGHNVKGYVIYNDGNNTIFIAHNMSGNSMDNEIDINTTRFNQILAGEKMNMVFNRKKIRNIFLKTSSGSSDYRLITIW